MRDQDRVHVWVQHFRDRGNLVLQWFDPDTGVRKSKSAETSDPEAAERRRADHEYELNHGQFQPPSRMDWDRFRELFEAEHLGGLRAKSQEKYRTVLDVFEEIAQPKKLKGVDERRISAFVAGMRERKRPKNKTGLAPMTIRNYLVSLKTALAWAVGQKLLPRLPRFPTIKAPKKKPQPVSAAEYEKLLGSAPDEQWRAYLMCGWWGGLRLNEAFELRREKSDEQPWLDLSGNRIVLPAVFAKSAVDQSVPLHNTLKMALENVPNDGDRVFPFRSRKGGGLLSRTGISQRVRLIAKKAGVRLSMHQLRKGFGCRVAKQLGKGNAPILHSLMRHSAMQITMDYYASVDDALQDAMKDLT